MENMDYDVGKAFAVIENELLDSMMRNMKRHRVEETEEGFQWEQWQAKQLAGLEEYRRKHKGKLEERYESINSKMRMAILQANAQGKMAQEKKILEAIRKGAKLHRATDKLQGEFFRSDNEKMDALLNAVDSDMGRAERAILRMHNDKVRRAIFNAQIYYNSGAGTYEKAIDMAVRDYAAAGINCVRYKNGRQVNIKTYAAMSLKTAKTRAFLAGEGEKRKEWGIHTVIVNKRGNPCPLCLPWVGKVMIDDVWSGGTEEEAKRLGYPLISRAMEAGLYHPSCRDVHRTYFPEISPKPDAKWKKSELEKIDKNAKREARQQYAKRQQEKFDRLERCAMDPENKRVYAARREEWSEKKTRIATTNRNRMTVDITDEYKSNIEGTGNIIFEKNTSASDQKITQWLYDLFGGNIKCLKENPKLGKMPDAIWNDIYWEYKAPSTKSSIDSRLKKAREQIEEAVKRDGKEYTKCGIVLDISGRKISLEDCIKCIEDRASDRCLNNTEVIIKDGDKLVKIIRVKK